MIELVSNKDISKQLFYKNIFLETCFSHVFTLAVVHKLLSLQINPFHDTGLFLYPMTISENQRFSNDFRECRKRPVS